MIAEVRWYEALCRAWSIDPSDAEWRAFAANAWQGCAGLQKKFLAFRQMFESRACVLRFQKNMQEKYGAAKPGQCMSSDVMGRSR